MTTAATTKNSEQPSLIAPPAEAEKPAQPSTAVQASAAAKIKKAEGIAEIVVHVPLNRIAPSPHNPRKNFDPEKIAGLAASIRVYGVQQPALLRPWVARAEDVQLVMDRGYDPAFNPGDEIFQIVFGERRWRGSHAADKETIPAIVRPIGNFEALKLQQIENLQREDLDPLDEAEGYKVLIAEGMTLAEISQGIAAGKGGKAPSQQYISSMVKLADLAEWAKQILRNKWISKGHAVLIARLGDYGAQERAMYAVFSETWNANHHSVVEAVRRKAEAGAPIMSEKALRSWIADNERCDLSKVPWKLDDADLLPSAGACTVCPHRSGSDPALFTEIAGDDKQRCMKPACFVQKRQTHINNERDNARMTSQVLQQISVQEAVAPALPNSIILKAGQWVLARRGECKQTIRAIYINGGDLEGHTPFVCADAKCKVHKHPPVVIPIEAKPAHHGDETRRTAGDDDGHVAQPPSAVNSGGTGSPAGMASSTTSFTTMAGRPVQAMVVDDREERMAAARHKAEAAVNELIVHRVLAAEAASIKILGADFLRPIAEFFLQNQYFDADRVIAGLGLDPDKLYESDPIEKIKNGKELMQLARLVWLLMVPDTIDHESDQVKMWAKRNKLDLGKVRKELTARIEKACFYCGCTDLTPCEGGCAWIPIGAPLTDVHKNVCSAEHCKSLAANDLEKHNAEGYKKLADSLEKKQTPVNQKPSTAKAGKDRKEKTKPVVKKPAPASKQKPKVSSQKQKAKASGRRK
ncbi:MAG TPA: ParB/RepB/Spo0J family partition protein [Candidatus Angelobacter sp.]|jgi:ParB/RepB/Spo0J family partition protein|nr:ParB/RepB/Spo0J family partition protein [Candidatus Angelobacter sp.]